MPLWQNELEHAIQAGRGVQETYGQLLEAIDSPDLRNVVRDLILMEEMNEVLLRSLGTRHVMAF